MQDQRPSSSHYSEGMKYGALETLTAEGVATYKPEMTSDEISHKHSVTPTSQAKLSKNHAAASTLTLSRSIEIIKGKSSSSCSRRLNLIILN